MFEGQFKENLINGFAWWMRFDINGSFECYIGFWENNNFKGFGKRLYSSGKIEEGIFENC